MSDGTLNVTGGCFCGKVRFHATGVRAGVSECHCTTCRKQTGHRYATTSAPIDTVEIEGGDNITWFSASPEARRGFCSSCGSHLFFEPVGGDHYAVLAGAIDAPNGLHMARHIFVESKGDYYEIDDGLPQFEGYDKPVTSSV